MTEPCGWFNPDLSRRELIRRMIAFCMGILFGPSVARRILEAPLAGVVTKEVEHAFTVSGVPGALAVFRNGLLMRENHDYSLSPDGRTVTMQHVAAGDALEVMVEVVGSPEPVQLATIHYDPSPVHVGVRRGRMPGPAPETVIEYQLDQWDV